MKYIYHHLGLGDHIICNGIVINFLQIYDSVTIFCKSHNFENVSYMYRDVTNLHIIKVDNDDQVRDFINRNVPSGDLIKVGHENLRWEAHGETFDQQFYESSGVPFDVRFQRFHLTRDLVEEEKVLKIKNPNNEPYIFVHDDPDRGFILDKVRQDLLIIKNDKSINIFHLLGLIEHAQEVHLMPSSIRDLCNSYNFENTKFFLHSYVRKYPFYLVSKSLNKEFVID